jgi:myosin protein heavy chain
MEHITQKLCRAQDNRNKADNERVAAERMWRAQVEALRAALEEKEEELLFMKEQGDDGSREEELLKRIEEDEAKIAALETMARGAEESKDKEKVQRLETQLQEERRSRVQLDERNVDLVKEKGEILDALEEARREVVRIVQQSKDREVLDHNLYEG